jgi:lysophospholipase L1-like esterase
MRVACFGDSQTFGSVSYSYRRYIKHKQGIFAINKGVNGDTTKRMHGRLKGFIKRKSQDKTYKYVVCIGTNDLLMPYLTTVSPSWHFMMSPRIQLMKCIQDDVVFEKEYESMIQTIKQAGADMVLIGLTHIELEHFPNNRIDTRNELIKRLADENQVPFIDALSIQNDMIQNKDASYTWKYRNVLRVVEGMVFPIIPGLKDWCCKIRKLNSTVDGVHWNSNMAKAIAREVLNELGKNC